MSLDMSLVFVLVLVLVSRLAKSQKNMYTYYMQYINIGNERTQNCQYLLSLYLESLEIDHIISYMNS